MVESILSLNGFCSTLASGWLIQCLYTITVWEYIMMGYNNTSVDVA
jgi:hypothetical protein